MNKQLLSRRMHEQISQYKHCACSFLNYNIKGDDAVNNEKKDPLEFYSKIFFVKVHWIN